MSAKPWKQSINAGKKHWVFPNDGRVKPINAGNAETAAKIVQSVNNYDITMGHLIAMLEDVYPSVTSTIQSAHDFVLAQGYAFHYNESRLIRYTLQQVDGRAARRPQDDEAFDCQDQP